jgi:hypothetical protein
MAVFDFDAGKQLNQCWFPNSLVLIQRNLLPQEIQGIEQWIHKNVFDAALQNSSRRMNVTEALRASIANNPDWNGIPLQPLYDKTGQDPERAAQLYGNLVCHVGIQRKEDWYCYSQHQPGKEHGSRTYFLK